MRPLVLACLVLAACQPMMIEPAPNSKDMGGQIVNDPNPAPQNKNGTRIKLQYAVTDLEDGTRYVSAAATYFDTALNAACAPSASGDGSMRCLPGIYGYTLGFYVDPSCAELAFGYAYSCGMPKPEYMLITESTGTCSASPGTQTAGYAVYRTGAPIESTSLYIKGPACRPATASDLMYYPSYKFVMKGQKMEPSEFVAVKK